MWRYLVLFTLVSTSLQQKDPLRDFCRRFGSQSAVVDDKLYLDGGLTNWNPIAQNPRNLSNTWLLWHDLSQSPNPIGVAPLHANLSKNASIPSVSGGSFWPDEVNKRIYLYGGEYTDVTPNQPEVLSYDIINDDWQSSGRLGYSIGSVAWGGSVGISDLAKGYVLGGWMSNATMPGWIGGPVATSYLLQYDMISGDWQNRTGPNNIPKAEGTLQHVPVGNAGILVYFGGGLAPYGNETLDPLPMSKIYIYDIKSSQWYEQQADGDIPAARRRFCAGVGGAADGSSYNIYLYGGLGFGANYTGFDDVYILSLPSFKWVKYWEGTNSDKPHHSLTCNVIHKGQMAIAGGNFPLTDSCDSPSTWGVHNLDMGKVSGYPWAEYRLNVTDYNVPPEIVSIIGGTAQGGATVKSPLGGFKNFDLDIYFRQRAIIATRTPTRAIPTPTSSPPSETDSAQTGAKLISPGVVAGIAIGGAFVLLSIVLVMFFLIHRHRKKNAPYSTSPTTLVTDTHPYTPGTYPPTSPYSTNNSPFSFPAPNYHEASHTGPVELAATRTHEIVEVDSYETKGFPFTATVSRGGVSPNSYTESPTTTMTSSAVSPHRGSFPSEAGDVAQGRGGSVGSLGRQIKGVELVSPQLTVSSIETRPSKFQNQTFYSP